jgi:predicted  nucleic acid-binding Zn-ribbon protein
LIDTLQIILDQIESRRDDLEHELERVMEIIDDLYEDVTDITEKAQTQSDNIEDWFNFDRIQQTTSKLTEVNQVLDKFDNAGKLKELFPSDQLSEIKKTRKELREGIARVLNLLEDRKPSDIAKTMRTQIEPYLKNARSYFNALKGSDTE